MEDTRLKQESVVQAKKLQVLINKKLLEAGASKVEIVTEDVEITETTAHSLDKKNSTNPVLSKNIPVFVLTKES